MTRTRSCRPAPPTWAPATHVFSVRLLTAGSWTVTATDQAGALTAGTSPSITVNVGSATQFQVLLPGETAVPGSVSGKSGTPTDKVAGGNIMDDGHRQRGRRVQQPGRGRDAHRPPQLHGRADDEPIRHGARGGRSSVQVRTATGDTGTLFTATDVSTLPTLITRTSDELQASAGAATHLSVSAPASTTSGLFFQVTVTALDAWNNVATTYAGTVHYTVPSDASGSKVLAIRN